MAQGEGVAALILAGGEGRRMGGRDKAFLSLGGRSLIAHVISRVAPQTPSLAISANGEAARFADFSLPVLSDPARFFGMGPLAGILAGLVWAEASGKRGVVSLPVDAPFLPLDIVARLAAAEPLPSYAHAGGRAQNATAYWPTSLRGELEDFLASGAKPKIADFAALYGANAVEFADPAAFDNLNRPEDLAAAEARLSGAGGGGA